MGKQYAIRSDIMPGLLTPEQENDLTHRFLNYDDRESVYQRVPQIAAEVDEENGRWAIFATSGERLTHWRVLEEAKSSPEDLGPVQIDNFGQELVAGDYAFSHGTDFESLELSQILRNTKARCVAEKLSSQSYSANISNRDPFALFRVPIEVIEGGVIPTMEFDTIYSVREEILNEQNKLDPFVVTDEATARNDVDNGYFSLIHSTSPVACTVTGWIKIATSQWEDKALAKKKFGHKFIVTQLETPLTDAIGLELFVGDWVVTGDNHYSDFMLAKVIGFTDNKVHVVGYKRYGAKLIEGSRDITMNWPKNVVKLPIQINN